MSGRRIAGVILIAVGMVVLLWGGIFWTDRDTVVDAGPVEITTEEREGLAVPPIIGGVLLVSGVLLVLVPGRRHV